MSAFLDQPPALLVLTALALIGAWSLAFTASRAVLELAFRAWDDRKTKTEETPRG